MDRGGGKKRKRHRFLLGGGGDAGRVSPPQERHGCFCGAFWGEQLGLACGLEISIHTGGGLMIGDIDKLLSYESRIVWLVQPAELPRYVRESLVMP